MAGGAQALLLFRPAVGSCTLGNPKQEKFRDCGHVKKIKPLALCPNMCYVQTTHLGTDLPHPRNLLNLKLKKQKKERQTKNRKKQKEKTSPHIREENRKTDEQHKRKCQVRDELEKNTNKDREFEFVKERER